MQTDAPAIEKGGIKEFQKRPDLFRVLCWVASAAAVATLAWIIFEITRQAVPSIQKFGLGFLSDSRWVPNRNIFGVAPFLIGTAVSSLIALIFALPLGLAIAIFLSEDFLPSPRSPGCPLYSGDARGHSQASSTDFGASSLLFRSFKPLGRGR